MTNPWYVITGGPCAGKTTLAKELERRGYRVAHEVARTFIERELSKGKTLEDIRKDEAAFQRALIPLKVQAEKELPTDVPVFFDSGMHDSAAYLAFVGVHDDPVLADALSHATYRRVFLLDLLPFVKDEARTENIEEAQKIHHLREKVYLDAGMEVVRVPVLPVSERTDFVLANL